MDIRDVSTRKLKRIYLKRIRQMWRGPWTDYASIYADNKQSKLNAQVEEAREELYRRGWGS